MANLRIPLFRIWYSTTYTTLLIILLLLLCVSPGDIIYQTIKTHEIQKLFVIGGVYLLTALIILLIYSTRIYTNRTVLAAMPKPYLPVEDGEVGRSVRRMIVKHLRRSAIIAWDSRPRDVRGEAGACDEEEEGGDEGTDYVGQQEEKPQHHHLHSYQHRKRASHHIPDAIILPVSHKSPPWGLVSHPGWASPASPDIPDLQYWSVVCELPNLIEAKAVSLAPPDPALEDDYSHDNERDTALRVPSAAANLTPILPDAQIVALLQRPRAMCLREYLHRLSSFSLINPPDLAPSFLAQYEAARFSTEPLTSADFTLIMSTFAQILDGMSELPQSVIEDARAAAATEAEADGRSIAPTESTTYSYDYGYGYDHGHRNHTRIMQNPSLSSLTDSLTSSLSAPNTARTAPSRQRTSASYPDSDTGSVIVHSAAPGAVSSHSLALSRSHARSQSSLRSSTPTSRSGSDSGSVIRLHPSPRPGELPYQYQWQGSQQHQQSQQSQQSQHGLNGG